VFVTKRRRKKERGKKTLHACDSEIVEIAESFDILLIAISIL